MYTQFSYTHVKDNDISRSFSKVIKLQREYFKMSFSKCILFSQINYCEIAAPNEINHTHLSRYYDSSQAADRNGYFFVRKEFRKKWVGKSFALSDFYTMDEGTARDGDQLRGGNGGLARRNSIALEKQADPLVTNATWLSAGAISNAVTKFGLRFLVFGTEDYQSFTRIFIKASS